MNINNFEKLMNKHAKKMNINDMTYNLDGKLKRALGICNSKTNHIKFNKPFVESNPEHVVEQVVIHELAHIKTPGMKHNKVFKGVCKHYNCISSGLVFNHPDFVRIKRNRIAYNYMCVKCNVKFTHFKKHYLNGIACVKCGGNIKLVKTEKVFK